MFVRDMVTISTSAQVFAISFVLRKFPGSDIVFLRMLTSPLLLLLLLSLPPQDLPLDPPSKPQLRLLKTMLLTYPLLASHPQSSDFEFCLLVKWRMGGE